MPTIAESFTRPALDDNRFPPALPERLYHVTRETFLPSILLEGLRVHHCGRVHGRMPIRPPTPTLYLSRHPNSNNLHKRLFEGDSRIVVLDIDTSSIRTDSLYPDDFLFVGFGLEQLFQDAEEVSRELGIDIDDAQVLLDDWETTLDTHLADRMRWLWPWYLHVHGEVSTTQDIPASAIVAVRDYWAVT